MSRPRKIMFWIAVMGISTALFLIPRMMMRDQRAHANWLPGQGVVERCEMVCHATGHDKAPQTSEGCVNTAQMVVSWYAGDKANHPIYYNTMLHNCSEYEATHSIPIRYAPQPSYTGDWPAMIGYDWDEEQRYGGMLNHLLSRIKTAMSQ